MSSMRLHTEPNASSTVRLCSSNSRSFVTEALFVTVKSYQSRCHCSRRSCWRTSFALSKARSWSRPLKPLQASYPRLHACNKSIVPLKAPRPRLAAPIWKLMFVSLSAMAKHNELDSRRITMIALRDTRKKHLSLYDSNGYLVSVVTDLLDVDLKTDVKEHIFLVCRGS